MQARESCQNKWLNCGGDGKKMWEAWKQVFNETKQLSEQAFKNVSNQKQIIILFDISKIVSYTTWKH